MNIGKVSENVLKRSVLKNIQLNSKEVNGAAAGADCAISCNLASATGYVANESDTLVAAHAIFRAANNLAAAGYAAKDVMLTISLPERFREVKLKEIMKGAMMAADTLGIRIIGGHTETVAAIEKPIVSAFATADTIFDTAKYQTKTCKPRQAIVMTKWMAISGSVHVVKEHSSEIAKKLPQFIIDDVLELEQFYSVIPEAAVAVNSDVTCMHDCADGGIFAALWQLADRDNVGLTVDLKKIPVRQECIEVCEIFDINPYKLRSDGSMLIVTSNPEMLIENLAKRNIFATVIGYIEDGIDRVILSNGERRFLEEPRQDEFHNIR
ncbi:MAG: hydrogenase maturation factor [Lachnospiraceae bacterium]|nr:hydrogenase maturation factor [Candidatus Colinaster equi]